MLAAHGDEAKLLAGGQSLVPLLALRLARCEHLIDINGVDALTTIARANGSLRIGAMVRQATIEADLTLLEAAPLLTLATPHIGHFQIRNRGTIGGSVAHADPAAEYPAVAVALDAEIEIASATSRRVVAATDFFDGAFSTALEDDELLVAINLPVWPGQSGFAIREVARRHGDFALAGAAVGIQVDQQANIDRAAVVLFGVGNQPQRATAAEAALLGMPLGKLNTAELGRLATTDLLVIDDGHASASYRRRVGAHLAGNAIASAVRHICEEEEKEV